MTEWRTIKAAPSYEASDEGIIRRVKSVRYFKARPKELKPWLNSRGYPVVRLRVGGVAKRFLVHRIIASTFLPDPPPCMKQVDHKDRDRGNCAAANLRWSDQAQNAANSPHTNAFRGVCKKGRRWKAYGSVSRKTVYLGTFDAPDDAARAFDAFAKARYGEFATLNFPAKLFDEVAA